MIWFHKSLLALATVCVSVLFALPGQAQETTSALQDRMSALKGEAPSRWLILPYKPSYIMPFTYFDDPNEAPLSEEGGIGDPDDELDDVEVKFQFSFILPLVRNVPHVGADLHFAYSQVSFWQLYNGDLSAPFRDTNYEPEGFFLWDTDFDILGFNNTAVRFGYVHQSNGRGSDVLTRSWDRLFAAFIMERGDLTLALKPWIRISDDEDNERIDNYLGYGELRAIYKHEDHVLSGMLRNNLKVDGNRGAIELAWSYPMNDTLRWYVQFFNGYGENLLDYDYNNNRIGVGVMLNDWL